MLKFFSWPFMQENSLASAGWNFWVSIVSLALTVIGFWITFQQLRKTKTAATAAQLAATNVKNRLAEYDATHDVAEARYALGVSMDHVNNDAWENAVKSYEDVRRAILRLRAFIPDDDTETIAHADTMIKKIGRFCKVVELALDSNGSMPSKANVKSSMRKDFESIMKFERLLHGKVN